MGIICLQQSVWYCLLPLLCFWLCVWREGGREGRGREGRSREPLTLSHTYTLRGKYESDIKGGRGRGRGGGREGGKECFACRVSLSALLPAFATSEGRGVTREGARERGREGIGEKERTVYAYIYTDVDGRENEGRGGRAGGRRE